METKKQEAIRLAYVKLVGEDKFKELKPFIREDGSCIRIDYSSGEQIDNHVPLNDMGIYQEDNSVDSWYEHKNLVHVWRPKELENIQHNNGWISLKGVANEITDRCSMWIMTKNGIEYLKENEFLPIGYATHYQPIQKPNPPIF